ncbi:hypothetical protein MEA186_26891 [Mesorhizobium amorphae CCNWGS0123]|uniref:Uncharacterized protein n=1 Tax=Mesorhizobium amorphae CCNWGS0123 TaxID=1082933 RepID=G6YHB1_9HYPH|nr:hypothetical protein MEA186_26891 [Mesorhizobium amorphae CCNWGS0123]
MQSHIKLCFRDCVLVMLGRDVVDTPLSWPCIQVGHDLPMRWESVCLPAPGFLIGEPGFAFVMPRAFFSAWRFILRQ